MKAFKDTKEENRISLVYELNADSPLFARIAEFEFENENFNKALEVLDNGIAQYPDYATAYFLKAKILSKLGNFDQAKETIEQGNELLDFDDTRNSYFEIIGVPEPMSDSSEDRMKVFVPGSFSDMEENDPFDNATNDSAKREFDELDKLEMELSNAKIPNIEDEDSEFETPENFQEDNEIVTETMANIYLEQGNVSEALSIFEKLVETKPEQAEYFRLKIEEIKNSNNF